MEKSAGPGNAIQWKQIDVCFASGKGFKEGEVKDL